MRIIGITGGVGAGKSAVLNYLEERYGAVVVQADHVGHLVMEPGESCYEPVLELFGDEMKNPDGRLNRKAIGQKVFGDDTLLRKLNAIIHPAVKTYIRGRIADEKEKGTTFFIIEAALLIEDDYGAICDEMWYIYTSEPARRQRLKESRGYTDEYISRIMGEQSSDEVFRRACDWVLDNSFSFESTRKQIDKRMQQYESM